MDEIESIGAESPVPSLPVYGTDPPVCSQAELCLRWRQLMGPGGFEQRTLWLIWFDAAGYQLPVVVPIEGLPAAADQPFLDGLAELLGATAEMVPRPAMVAMLLSRPGPATLLSSDRAWARELRSRCARLPLRVATLHLATAGRVRPITADDT